MVTQFWNCPAPTLDRVITCLKLWAPPLASWQAVIVVQFLTAVNVNSNFLSPGTITIIR